MLNALGRRRRRWRKGEWLSRHAGRRLIRLDVPPTSCCMPGSRNARRASSNSWLLGSILVRTDSNYEYIQQPNMMQYREYQTKIATRMEFSEPRLSAPEKLSSVRTQSFKFSELLKHELHLLSVTHDLPYSSQSSFERRICVHRCGLAHNYVCRPQDIIQSTKIG